MFGPRNPRLPTEVCLAIFKDPVLTAIDLLRCSSVNRAWHTLLHNTNDIRTLMFLPPLTSDGKLDIVKAPVQDEPAWMALLYKPPRHLTADYVFAAYERYDQAGLLSSWDSTAAHPLLFEFKQHAPRDYTDLFDHADIDAEAYPQRGYLGLTYQLFQHLSQPQYSHESASWRHMRVANPPIRDVLIRLHPGSSIRVYNEYGVTLGHVVDKLRRSGPWRSYDVAFGGSGQGADRMGGQRWYPPRREVQ